MNTNEADIIKNGRLMLKPDWDGWDRDSTDQKLEKPAPERIRKAAGKVVPLPGFDDLKTKSLSLVQCLENRRSKRKYTDEPLTREELSCLLWAANGVREIRKDMPFRTYPSGGNTQALNLYVYVGNVNGLENGLYGYLPIEGALELISAEPSIKEQLDAVTNVFNAQTAFIWTALPYRTEYRYSTVSHKMIAMEAGHACQNLYLAAESLGMGCVAIAAFSQEKADTMLGLEGEEEFAIYMAAAGR